MGNKWELKLHEDFEDPYFEITNGPISLCSTAGYVGETEDEEEAIFKKVADSLNESGIDFHSESPLELKQHIEIQEWQLKYDELKSENERLKQSLSKYHDVAIENKSLQAKAQRLVDALEQLLARFKPEPHNTWDKKALLVANSALQEWNTKEAKEREEK